MKPLLAVLIVATGSLAWGQCPVQVTNFHYLNELVGSAVEHGPLGVYYSNISDREIVGIKFSVVFVDATMDEHNAIGDFGTTHKTKPGKKGRAFWDYPFPGDGPYAKINVLKVLYADDTKWENDSSCVPVWDGWYRHKHKKPKGDL